MIDDFIHTVLILTHSRANRDVLTITCEVGMDKEYIQVTPPSPTYDRKLAYAQ